MLKKKLKRVIKFSCGLLLALGLWQLAIFLFQIPTYLLPRPTAVLMFLINNYALLLQHAVTTLMEVLLSLVIGCCFGFLMAYLMLCAPKLQKSLQSFFILSQCVPIFIISPFIVLWFGFGLVSKIIIASLLIFFPVVINVYDGLSRTPVKYLELASTMNAKPWLVLRYIRLPAALPLIVAGLKLAAVAAPIGAVVGEWAGASSGLGYFMQYSNNLMDIEGMFAALILLAAGSIVLYLLVDWLGQKLLFWLQ